MDKLRTRWLRRMIKDRKRTIASRSVELIILTLITREFLPYSDLLEVDQCIGIASVDITRALNDLESLVPLLALTIETNKLTDSIAASLESGEY